MNLRDTLFWSRELAARTQIVQVDIDPTMLGRDYPVPHTVVGDCQQTLAQLRGFADGPLHGGAATDVRHAFRGRTVREPHVHEISGRESHTRAKCRRRSIRSARRARAGCCRIQRPATRTARTCAGA